MALAWWDYNQDNPETGQRGPNLFDQIGGVIGAVINGYNGLHDQFVPKPKGDAWRALGGSQAGQLQGGQQNYGAPDIAAMRSANNGASYEDIMRDRAMQRQQFLDTPNTEPPMNTQRQAPPFDPRQAYIAAIERPFQFDPNGVDTSFIDKALAQRMQALQGAHDTAQGNFDISNKNIGDMYNQYQQHILSQAPAIQQRYQDAQNDVGSVFDKTIADAQAHEQQYQQQREEMLQRLGIQAAANQPDIVGQEIQRNIGTAQGSKNSRLSSLKAQGQSAVDFNTGMADLATAEAASRRSDLQRQLNNIFGQLNTQGANYQADAALQKQQFVNEMLGNAFKLYENERQFNEDALNKYNNYLIQNRRADAAIAHYQGANGTAGKNPALQGILGLDQAFDPSVSREFQNVLSENPNLDMRQPASVWSAFQRRLAAKKTNVDPNAFYQYMTAYGNLGNTSNFPQGQDVFVDNSQ